MGKLSALDIESTFGASDYLVKVKAAGAGDVLVTLADFLAASDKIARTGWLDALPGVSSATANGNGSYTINFASSVAAILSAGMRLRAIRGTASPIQCTSLNGTTQYWSKSSPAGMTFTDDFACSAWVYLTSYPGAASEVISRYNGTSGWIFRILSTGQIHFAGVNGGAGNYSNITSYDSIPLNRWVHVAAQLDMSAYTATPTTSYTMINGVDTPCYLARAGTNPTSLVQAGDLQIGASNSTSFFGGKIAQAVVWPAKVTQANMLLNYHQGITGSVSGFGSAYSFDGNANDINTTNANNLSAVASAGHTTASPYGNNGVSTTVDYALVMSVSGSTVVVQVPEGCTLPTIGSISSILYSTADRPYGWPDNKSRWEVVTLQKTNSTAGSVTTSVAANINSFYLDVPIGAWSLKAQGSCQGSTNAANGIEIKAGISNATNTFSETGQYCAGSSASTTYVLGGFSQDAPISLTVASRYYVNLMVSGTGTLTASLRGDSGGCSIKALPAGL